MLILSIITTCSGCLAEATPEVTYKSSSGEYSLILTGGGKPGDDSTYIWTSPSGVDSGNWYRTSETNVYLDMGSYFEDLPLVVEGDAIIWPNGMAWHK